jgi:sugar O-acyltransferase (sialic acid O-acetyltransferase NeuD family)
MGRLSLSRADGLMNRQVIVLGGGGHASVLIATLLMLNYPVLGFVDPTASRRSIFGVKHLGDDSVLRNRARNINLANGIGSVGSKSLRYHLFRRFSARGFRFISVAHPAAIVASDVRLGEGAQVMAGAVIQPGSRIGANCIINTGAIIDHDCRILAHAHIAPGATLSGKVRIAVGAHIGIGASVIQGIQVGAWSIVGAGAAVVRDVPGSVTAVGVPARWQIG